MNSIQQACDNMIRQQIRTVGVLNDELLAIIQGTPRVDFVPAAYKDFAYADMNIPLAHGQQMLMPQDEAIILQALELKDTDRVLEIGTGTGYFTALLAQCVAQVTTVDIYEDFIEAAKAQSFLKNFSHIEYHCADYAQGPSDEDTYDAIVITGALEVLPERFLHALKPQGRLVAIIGESKVMHAKRYQKAEHTINEKLLFETVTPYLVNAYHKSKFSF